MGVDGSPERHVNPERAHRRVPTPGDGPINRDRRRLRRPDGGERRAGVPRPESNTYRPALFRLAQDALIRFDIAFLAAALHGFRFVLGWAGLVLG